MPPRGPFPFHGLPLLLLAACAPGSAPAPMPQPASEPAPAADTPEPESEPAPEPESARAPAPPAPATLRACAKDGDCTSRHRSLRDGKCCISCARPYAKAGLPALDAYCAQASHEGCGGQPRCMSPPPPRCVDGLCALPRPEK